MIEVPIEVLALRHWCGESGESIRHDLHQVRVGWDAEGPWAAATDGKAFALARWARLDGDPPEEAVEFGVRPEQLRVAAEAAAVKPSLWRDVVVLGPGYAEVSHHPAVGKSSVLARGDVPEDWLKQSNRDIVLASLRSGSPVEPLALPHLSLRYLTLLGDLALAVSPECYEAQARVHRPASPSGGAWVVEIGEHESGLLNRGLRVWCLVMGLEAKSKLREWAPSGGVRASAHVPIAELEPVIGGEA